MAVSSTTNVEDLDASNPAEEVAKDVLAFIIG